jgi:hypothetical protein
MSARRWPARARRRVAVGGGPVRHRTMNYDGLVNYKIKFSRPYYSSVRVSDAHLHGPMGKAAQRPSLGPHRTGPVGPRPAQLRLVPQSFLVIFGAFLRFKQI